MNKEIENMIDGIVDKVLSEEVDKILTNYRICFRRN